MSDNIARNSTSRMGCHFWGVAEGAAEAIPAFASVGCRWARASWVTMMDLVGRTPGQFAFDDRDSSPVNVALREGMSLMAILEGRWGHETHVNHLPHASPIWEHLDQWEAFTTACVEQYRGRIRYWEILNEPPFFWWYPPAAGETWPETNPPMRRAPIAKYAELLKVSARAIRAADPDAVIVAGSTFADGSFLRRLYELGATDDFDIVAVHYLGCKHPEDFGRGLQTLRAIMSAYGDEGKPIWDTESGPGGAVIGHAVDTPQAYEALYNIYRHCFAHQFGLDRYFWFNPVQWGGNHGVTDESGLLAPPYRSLQTLHSLIGEGALLAHEHPEGETHVYLFQGCQGPVSIVWATAPATARLSGAADAFTHLGQPMVLRGEFPLSGQPLFVPGDIRRMGFDVTVRGKRETVVTSMAGKNPPPDTRTLSCAKTTSELTLHHADWAEISLVARRAEVPVVVQDDHFCRVTSSVAADVWLAYDDEALYVRVQTEDRHLDHRQPTGLVQFTLRDENPEIVEWPFFTNAYALYSLYASPRGPLLLRYEPLYPDDSPAGKVTNMKLEVEAQPDGLLYCARIPWRELGPCRPGRYQPCVMLFTFNRADGLLDVPDTDTPEEWSHNFVDNFIVKKPALCLRVRFA